MTSKTFADHKPHVICFPSPAQSHIKSMLKLAKLLYCKGFHVTFVNTEFNHRRLLKSRGSDSLKGLPDFRFESIPDGLPPSDENVTQDLPRLCEAARNNFLAPFNDLLDKLNGTASPDVPPVTCIVSDDCNLWKEEVECLQCLIPRDPTRIAVLQKSSSLNLEWDFLKVAPIFMDNKT
uniref:Uncharacterized protein n=1 Tax=Salix viminalis TaxID=40686 RepID=A0A6N2MQF1_SALVM